jgi:hypothetical protein
MQRILNFLDGKKTILGFMAVVIYAGLIQFAGVPSEEVVWGIIVAWTGVSLRLAQK